MQLKYIEIQGFKSFPDRTRITFENGYTGIVGPNGSGKSNISDAVRWVLGEQSSKSLRGEKMEDVVFTGTQLRKPMGYAQVSLCLDNSDRRIADMGDELVVARRYYRSGDSDYLLNGNPVRLRDIRETFMDTGLGRDGYSIIGQNRITEIVSSKPVDRREIFEEASGIAKYRFRKNEASHRLDAAEENLARLRDILGELESRIEPLSRQAEKAKRFLELSEERKGLEVTLYCETIDRAIDNIRAQNDKIDISAADYREVQDALDELSEKTEQLYDDNRARNARIEQYSGEISELQEKAALAGNEAAVCENDISHAEERIAELSAEIESIRQGGDTLPDRIAEQERVINEINEKIDARDAVVAELEEQLTRLAEENEISESTRRETVKKLTEIQDEITSLRLKSASASAEIRSGEERINILKTTGEQLSSRLADAEKSVSELREERAALEKDLESLNNRLGGYNMKLSGRSEAAEKARAVSEDLERRKADFENRASVLRDMERTMDGYLPPVRRVTEASAGGTLRGIIGTVASLTEVKPGCELAIETALGNSAQDIVVSDERAAKQAIAFLKESRAGRATFQPVDTVKPVSFEYADKLPDEGIVGMADSLVSCDSRYSAIISRLLGRTVIAEDLDSAQNAAKKLGYRARIVTLDGQVINAGGSYTGGFTSRRAGLFSRRSEIESLEKNAAEAAEKLADAEAGLEKINREISDLNAEKTAVESDIQNLTADFIRVDSEITRLDSACSVLSESMDAAKAETEDIEKRIAESKLILTSSDNRIELLSGEASALENASGGDNNDAEAYIRSRTSLTDAITENKIQRVELAKDAENARIMLESIRRSGSDADDRIALLDEAISQTRTANDARRAHLEDINSRIALLRVQTSELRDKIEQTSADRGNAEKQITVINAEQNELIEKRQNLASERARLEERKESMQKEYDDTVGKLWEDYELTRNEALALCVPFANVTELRSRVTSVRNRIRSLGDVNVGAIDELKEVSERYEFMKDQVEDVERSRNELMRLISSLEGEMRTIFSESFSRINSRFETVFRELFGGGSARLYFTDEDDILESGIEIEAQPPGKIIKNLASLSGGEQSLLAIAIYFAILAVNPSPFCILDEIDSALDESNVNRFADYLSRVSRNTQIIAITHRRGTMEGAGVLYGVTMQEEGVSRVLKMNVDEAILVIEK